MRISAIFIGFMLLCSPESPEGPKDYAFCGKIMLFVERLCFWWNDYTF